MEKKLIFKSISLVLVRTRPIDKVLIKTRARNCESLSISQLSRFLWTKREAIRDGIEWQSERLISRAIRNDLCDNRLISEHAWCGLMITGVHFLPPFMSSCGRATTAEVASMVLACPFFSLPFSFLSPSCSFSFNRSLRVLDFLIRQLKVSPVRRRFTSRS